MNTRSARERNANPTAERTRIPAARRILCTVLAAGLAFEPALVQAATPASVPISDLPVASGIASAIKPNLLFILDDSTSMSFEFMSGSGDEPAWQADRVGRFASACNTIYYNPATTYQRPPAADPLVPNYPKASSFAAAPVDGFDKINTSSPKGYVQPAVSSSFSVNWSTVSPSAGDAARTNADHNLGSTFSVLIRRDPVNGDTWWQFPGAFYVQLKAGATFDPLVDCQDSLSSVGSSGSKWTLVNASSLDDAGKQNFANWYSYYRSRANAMKSATGRTFSTVDIGLRLGLVTVNPSDSGGTVRSEKYLPIADLDAAQRTAWLNKMYKQIIESGKETPLPEALSRAGRHFAGKDDDLNKGMINAATDDPVQYSCQRNIALLTTDGFWNQAQSRTVSSSWVPDLDHGTPCTGTGCSSGQVARPFNDELMGTQKTLELVSTGRWPNWDSGGNKPASNECAYLNGLATNPNTGETLPTTIVGNQGPTPVVGWVPIYKSDNKQVYRRVKPKGYDFEVNLWPETTGSTPVPEDPAVYKITNDPTRGCRPYAFHNVASSEGTVWRVQFWVFQPSGEITDFKHTGSSPWTGDVGSTLSDVAMYYYTTDLRQSASGFKSTNKAGLDVSRNNVPVGDAVDGIAWQFSTEDRAKHQHMTTFTLGFGVSGSLKYDPAYDTASTGDFADIRSGAKDWLMNMQNVTIYLANDQAKLAALAAAGWPVTKNADGTYFPTIEPDRRYDVNMTKIDDLWHAAVDGRGLYMSARNADEVVDSLARALARISQKPAAGSAPTTTTLQPTAGNDAVYVPSYVVAAWSGELVLRRFDLDKTHTTTYGTLLPAEKSATAAMAGQVQESCDSRRIFYLDVNGGASALVNFTWKTNLCGSSTDDSLPTAAKTALDATLITEATTRDPAVAPEALVAWLRGQWSLEDRAKDSTGADKAIDKRLFRERKTPLGDIVGSSPVYVKGPGFAYGDAGYSAFRDLYTLGTGSAKRKGTLYVGANDGMLHAFNAEDLSERWAVVPHQMLGNLPRLASRSYAAKHKFYVDGTPTVGDVYDGANWRTILVGGFNAGGEGYYALDVTEEGTPQRLWSFTNADLPSTARDLGKSFGNPIITKRADTGQWVVLVTSGYNSATGRGVLYMLDAALGPAHPDGVKMFDVGEDPAGAEIGLAKISNFVDNTRLNNATRFVYGGDLKGNVWRFDITATSAATAVAKVGRVTNAGGTPLPITTAPELAKRRKPAAPMVIVATGKYLDVSDFTAPVADGNSQGVFAFADDHGVTSPVTKARADLQKCSLTETVTKETDPETGVERVTAVSRTSSCTGSGGDPDGWFMEMPDPAERITVAPRIQLGTLAFLSNKPGSDPCDGGGGNLLHFVDFETGGAVPGAVGAGVATMLPGELGAGFTLVQKDNELWAVGQDSGGKPFVNPIPTAGGLPDGRRVSWRELAR